HHTSGAAERLGRTRGLGSAITHAPRFLASVLDKIALAAAVAGAVIVTAALRARAAMPWAVLGLGGIAFLVLGATDQPLLPRSLLERRGVKGFLDRCPPIQVTYYRFGPLAAYLIDRQASAVTSVTGSLAQSGSLLTRSTSGRQRPPTGFRIAYRSKPWALAARCAR